MKGVVILGFLLAACYVGGSLGHRDLTSMEAAEEAAEEAMEVAMAAEEAEEEEEAGGARGMTGRQIGGGRFQTRREAQRQVRARVAAVNVARFVSFLLRLDRDRTRALVVNFLQALANAAAPPTTPILAVTTPILAVTTPTAAQSPAPTTGQAVEGSSTPPSSADPTTPTPVQDAEVVRELRTLLDELQEG